MHSILSTGDTGLYLTPRLGDMPLEWQVVLTALMFLIPVGLIVWLYFYELRLLSGLTAAGLLGGRCLVVAALVFVVMFQPVLAQTTTTDQPGRVLVAVDRSDSMDVTDPQRTPLEKLLLARALKLTEDRQRLDEWIAAYEAGRAPSLAGDARREHDTLCQQVDALTRTETARRLLSPAAVRLLDRVGERHSVELIGFAQESWDVPREPFDELFKPLRSGDATKRGASAYTDLRLPLELAEKRSGANQGPVLGLVVLTDGRHNWGTPPVAKAIELGSRSEGKIPVYPLALGAVKPPPDVAVVAVKAPPAVFKGADAQVEAQVRISGMPAQDVVVEMQRPGQQPLREVIKHDGKDGLQSVRFTTKLDQAGTQTLTVTARPPKADTRPDNNSRPATVNVADDKARVLLIDGEARWEWHYLATALERDPSMQVNSVVRQQPRLGKIAEDELLQVGNPSLTLPTGPDAFAPFDCIILGDVTPDQLSAEDRVRLERYVSDRGGTLVILAGKRGMPLGYLNGGGEDDPLRRLLPVESPQVVKPVDGFQVGMTREGTETPFLQLDAEPGQSIARWAELPKHYWGVVGKAKPGAMTLAYVASADDRRKAEEKERDGGLVVRQNYGFGRVLFVGLDSTWRWRFKTGDTYHHRFWGQAIRWAASDKPLVAGNSFARFGTREPSYRGGQDVDIAVRLAEEVKTLSPDAIVAARVVQPAVGDQPEKAVALVPLERNAGQSKLLEGKVGGLLPGRYELELVIPELADKLSGPPGPDGQPGKLRAEFAVLAPDGEEMIELGTNIPLLEELAVKSGGKVFTPETADELVEVFLKRSLAVVNRNEWPLWQTAWPMMLLLLLAVEWIVRRCSGLP